MSKHKKQHYIPRCYLKAWLDPSCPSTHEPYIWVFDKDTREGRNKSPDNVFHETDMYTIVGVDGSRDLTIEHGLSGLETEFATIRDRKLLTGLELTTEERAYLCAFIAAMHARTPRQREHIRSQWNGVLNIMNSMAEGMKTASEETKRSMAKISHKASATTKREGMTHEQVKELVENPIENSIFPMIRAETPHLLALNLAIFTTQSSPGFITSDYPVVWFDPQAYKRPPMYRAPALMYETIEITIPITPNHCIVLNRQGRTGYVDIPDEAVFQMNRRTIHYAAEQFIVNQDTYDENWFNNDSGSV